MSEVYQGHNRGGLINYLIVDNVKQLDVWAERFELKNFVNLEDYFNKEALKFTGEMDKFKYRHALVRAMPQAIKEDTVFYTVIDWEKWRQVPRTHQTPLEQALQDAGVPGTMLFIPTKVLFFTENEIWALRDAMSQQAAFIAGILHREGFTGKYHFSDGIPEVKGVQLKDSSVPIKEKSVTERLQARANPNNEQTIGEALNLEQAVHGVLRRALVQGSNIQLQGLDDGRVAVIIQTDDAALVQAFDASRARNG